MAHGGGGGGGFLSIFLFLGFIVAVVFALTAFPAPKFSGFGGSSSATSTAKSFKPSTYKPSVATIPKPRLQGSSVPGKSTVSAPAPAPAAKQAAAPSVAPQDIPNGFTAAQLSPYFHKIRLGGVQASTVPGGMGQVTISTYLSGDERVTVSGWRIQGRRGGSVYVPKAVRVYDASGLAPEEDIVMKSGDQLYLYAGGQSGFGKNLRINKCLGYLPAVADFKPSIPQSCPAVDRSEIAGFSGQCQNYVLSLGCRAPDMSDIRIPRNEEACRSFLQTLNYGGCLARHMQDKDFLQSQIYAWVGSISFDPFHDKALLLDTKGLLVDIYEY